MGQLVEFPVNTEKERTFRYANVKFDMTVEECWIEVEVDVTDEQETDEQSIEELVENLIINENGDKLYHECEVGSIQVSSITEITLLKDD